MKKLEFEINKEDDFDDYEMYSDKDLVELSEDITYLIENKPKKIRKGSKLYKQWIKSISERMQLYNTIVEANSKNIKSIYPKKYVENV